MRRGNENECIRTYGNTGDRIVALIHVANYNKRRNENDGVTKKKKYEFFFFRYQSLILG